MTLLLLAWQEVSMPLRKALILKPSAIEMPHSQHRLHQHIEAQHMMLSSD